MRDRSIAARTADLDVPDLRDPARIAQGAGNYDAMCTGCHLKPGVPETELSKGLYPAPPDLTAATVDAAKAFWVIKHGIKASGMPAWGRSMDDAYIWNMVAFLQELPTLDEAGYAALVARSGGHSHGGGETDGHAQADAEGMFREGDGDAHPPGTPAHAHSAAADPKVMAPAADQGTTHVHADGKQHVHGSTPRAREDSPPPPATPRGDAREAAEAPPPPLQTDEHEVHEHQH